MSLVRRRSGQMAYVPPAPPTATPLCFTAEEADSTIEMYLEGSPTTNPNFYYSTDGITWVEFIVGETVITLSNVNDKVYFKGNNPNGISESYEKYVAFDISGKVAASGNIMSLIDNGLCNTLVIPNSCCFDSIFSYCKITSPPELPATTLTDYCYEGMFYQCVLLSEAPTLPSTVLAEGCYSNMFGRCYSLSTPPQLPATTLEACCYMGMFGDCTSLSQAPELPATDLAVSCYEGMFMACHRLTVAPSLPATTLAEACYMYMFEQSESLQTPPLLPATTLVTSCYENMFAYCISLKVSDTRTSDATYAWTIPTSGAFSSTCSQDSMFTNCAGTRASDDMAGVAGQSYTYYTQNQPV